MITTHHATMPTGHVCVIGTGLFDDPDSFAMFRRNPEHYGDLMGREIEEIMPYLSWQFAPGEMLHCRILDRAGQCVAIGCAAGTDHEGGGVNLTYGVAPEAQGAGLARTATAIALLAHGWATATADQAVIHAQMDVRNSRSLAVARSLGLSDEVGLSQSVTVGAGKVRHFVGAAAAWCVVRPTVIEVAHAAIGNSELYAELMVGLEAAIDSADFATPRCGV